MIAPYFLFSALAGELADRFERARLLQILKAAELVTVLGSVAALLTDSLALSFLSLFMLGAQATLSSPVRYALLPQQLAADELVDGNALLEGGTFLSILFGTIAGGLAVAVHRGVMVAGLLLIVCAIGGFLASLFVPRAPAPSPGLRLSRNPVAATIGILRHAHERRDVQLAILGASWFWLVGAVFLSQLPSFAKGTLGAGSGVVTLFLAAFSIGVGVGSVLCGRLMHGEISARYVPLAALGMAVFSLDLALASEGATPAAGELLGIAAFLSRLVGIRIFADLLAIAICGGIFVVPLYAIIQRRSDEAARARIIAAGNIMNALFMTAAAVVTALLLAAGLKTPDLYLVLGIMNAGVALWICRLLPQDALRMLARIALRLAYRVEVRGVENLALAGERVVIVPNHVSFLDGPLIAAFLPGYPMFAIDTAQAARWWARPLLAGADIYPMDPTRPMATKSLIRALREGRQCVIFPEGRLNITGGALMKIYDGPALIADKGDASVLPVRIDGVEFTPFSRLAARLGGRLRRHWFPKVTITLYEPRRLEIPAGLRGRARRQRAGLMLYDMMSQMMARRGNPPSLFGALLAARRVHGGKHPILADPTAGPLRYDRLIAASLVFGRILARTAKQGEAVGLMIPNSIGAAIAFLALQADRAGAGDAQSYHRDRRVAVGLPHGAAAHGRHLAAVYRSREARGLRRPSSARPSRSSGSRICAAGSVRSTSFTASSRRASRDGAIAGSASSQSDPAVILFTSGSEGAPKGVVLSHANLLANCRQLAARVDFSPADHLLNVLPMFHSFGLTAGFLLPLLSGVRVFLYPSPLHYRIVPEIAYRIGATLLFGTDTFLAGYARSASPYDFYALRYVFAGAEAVRDETRRVWVERFGKRILEGYGVTECSPVIAVNTPMHFKAGTVGRLLPLIEHRLDPVPGIAEGGRLLLRGPNVMAGYLRAEQPGVLDPARGGLARHRRYRADRR